MKACKFFLLAAFDLVRHNVVIILPPEVLECEEAQCSHTSLFNSMLSNRFLGKGHSWKVIFSLAKRLGNIYAYSSLSG
jgi:hypothetical protein